MRIHVHLLDSADVAWIGEYSAVVRGNRYVISATVKAPDSYTAGDILKRKFTQRYGSDFAYPIVKFNRGAKLGGESTSARVARSAGLEEDMAIKGIKEDSQGIIYGGKWYHRITKVQSNGPGKYKIWMNNGRAYTLEGGKHLGGARVDWFLEGEGIHGHINVRGLVDTLQLLESM